jgi:hypothetical protein
MRALAVKNLLLFTFGISAVTIVNGQVPTAMSPEANAFYTNTMPFIRKPVKDIILKGATGIKLYKANADSLFHRLRSNRTLKGINDNDLEGITVLIMVQASKDADTDLKLLVLAMSRRNEQKQQERIEMHPASETTAANKNIHAEPINDIEKVKLQGIIERKRQLAEETSKIMAKISNRQQDIINSLM